jgi:addiction module HigA family antidote
MEETPVRIGMKPPHPGAFIREEVLEPLALSVTEAAQVLDVRRASLSDVLNGKASLSAEMALRVEKAFGVNMDTLLKMQAWFDTCAMREQSDRVKVQRYHKPMPA